MDSINCVSCGKEKPASEFGKDSRKKNGMKSSCKSCCNERARVWRKNNPERAAELDRERYWANPDKRREAAKEWYEKNTERARSNNISWRAANPDKVREDGRSQSRQWRANNLEQARQNSRSSQSRRRLNGVIRMEDSVRNIVSRSIRKGSKYGRRTFDLLGYTVDQLRAHLERQFQPGMTWENYGEWHIDHVIPLAAHNYETPDDIDFKKAWALSNLQPLWAAENRSKGSRLTWRATNDNNTTSATNAA